MKNKKTLCEWAVNNAELLFPSMGCKAKSLLRRTNHKGRVLRVENLLAVQHGGRGTIPDVGGTFLEGSFILSKIYFYF